MERPAPSLCALLLLVTVTGAACGGEAPYDPNNREISWTYGPTTGTARSEHLLATGTKGKGPIARGWQLRLQDGKTLSVRPFELSDSHALFGTAVMRIGLFDKTGDQIGLVRTEPITADNAAFSFELEAADAKRLHDVVLWFADS